MFQIAPLVFALNQASPALPVHHADVAAPGAWVAASRGHLWICWDGPKQPESRPDAACWKRVPIELATGSAPLDLAIELRVRFRDPNSLWVHAPSRGTWVIGRDGLAVESTDGALDGALDGTLDEALSGALDGDIPPLDLDPLAPVLCSTTGWSPRRSSGRWSWHRSECRRSAPCRRLPRVRGRPTGVRMDLAVGVGLRRRSVADESSQSAALTGQAMVTITVALDRRRAAIERQAIHVWNLRRTDPGEGLPVSRGGGRLAEHEHLALDRGQCRAWEGLR